ncbi:hypothetical protein EJF36_11555 [Bacillus sp. HMF5848]|uniref:hypothetical protein n=1 Tax=Bacillus sp. HMF5848 TaxID=2495421 RepID=UPI000F7AB0E8|nr:hypothetical protein [Bacillus sp. HMF5848]RSK27469.1 hypothetical protein EJF36_11555 [Bacillus sp. HMF5848]
MADNLKQMQEFLAEANPSTPEDIVLCFAYCKVHFEATQSQFSKEIGVSDRTLRKYISDNQTAFDEEKAQQEATKEPEADVNNLARTLTNEQLDAFLQNLIQSAIKPSASTKDKQLLIDFAGLSGQDLLNLTAVKKRSLHWFIKEELSSISQYLDSRQLGIMLEESDKLYREDRESKENTQNFVDADISDESFRLELMYYGLLFMSLYNQTQHPDLELLQQAVRLDRIQKGKATPLNKRAVKLYAKGNSIKQDANKKPISDEKIKQMYVEVFGKDEAEKMLSEVRSAKQTTKPPEIDKSDVKQRATEHQEELEILLSVEEEIQKMMRDNQ